MIEKIKVSDEVNDLICKFVESVKENYIKEEFKIINIIKEKIDSYDSEYRSHLIKIIGYIPIVAMMFQQYEILFLSLIDKNITKEQFKDIFFKEIKTVFYELNLKN